MQMTAAPSTGGLNTFDLLALLGRLEGSPLPHRTLARWARLGLISPSLFRSRSAGCPHRWSAADAVLVGWLARLRADGIDVTQYRRALRAHWDRLTERLNGEGTWFMVAAGPDVVAVLSDAEVLTWLRARSRSSVTVWPAMSIDHIRSEASAMGVAELP